MGDYAAKITALQTERDQVTSALTDQKASLDQQATQRLAVIDAKIEAYTEVSQDLSYQDYLASKAAQPEAQPEQGIDPATGQPYESSTPTVDANGQTIQGQPQDQQPQ